MRFRFRHALVGVAFVLPATSLACSSCGCTLSSDWDSQGFATKPGFRFDLRYDYLNQSQLRNGSHSVDRADFPPPQDFELEQDTINRYTTLGFDYSGAGDWGVNLQLPYVDRTHSTLPEGETEISTSASGSIGDVRVVARYVGLAAQKNVGLQFGLKLPTGRHDVVFATGSEAGETLDRGLQPGSGSTNLMLGAYRFGALGQNWDYFAQGMAEGALAISDHYRPGASLNLNLGLRYLGSETFVPELQLNTRYAARDSGAESDADNSGGTIVDLSPGLTVTLGEKMHLYAFVQLPVLQHVNGFQLTPRYTASIGARYDFR